MPSFRRVRKLFRTVLGINASVGINLGTSHFCIAATYYNGNVSVIPNEEGCNITSSLVSFTDSEILVGDAAKGQEISNPKNTVYDVKHLIGHDFDDPIVQAGIKKWSFTVVNDGGKPKIKVQYKGKAVTYSPEAISAMLITKMKTISEAYLGGALENVVITVPAHFNESQREATKKAGIIAGLNVLQVLDEPVAAAIAYDIGAKSTYKRHVLVFDFHTSSCDVTVIAIHNNNYEIRSVGGDIHFGSDNFTDRMVTYFVEKFNKKHKVDLSTDIQSVSRLRQACERAKHILSFTYKASIDVDKVFDGKDIYTLITKFQFENMSKDLLSYTKDLIEKALDDIKLDATEIEDVILTGDSAGIPFTVHTLLKKIFGYKKIRKYIKPEVVVAYGAALQAHNLFYLLSNQVIIRKSATNRPINSNNDFEYKSYVPDDSDTTSNISTYEKELVIDYNYNKDKAKNLLEIALNKFVTGNFNEAKIYLLKAKDLHSNIGKETTFIIQDKVVIETPETNIDPEETKPFTSLYSKKFNSMEDNKDEAYKCLRIAKKAITDGKLEKAERVLKKSLRMYPIKEVEDLLTRLETDLKYDQRMSESNSIPTNVRIPTREQEEAVQRVKTDSEDVYEILGLEKDTDDAVVSKTIKNLKLLLHPDKNSTLAARDAFLAVMRASKRFKAIKIKITEVRMV